MEKNSLKILIVDDTPENLLVIARTLEPEGYEMRFSQDGAAAINIAKETSFDLIILDVMMPNMDGFEVCRRLKEDPTIEDVPIIFITAKTDTNSIVKGFEVGGVDYLTKPFHIGELRARVGTHLKLRLRERELRQLNATKDKFIGIIAHELKIPLGGIKGFVNIMNEQFELCSIADIRENISLVKDAVENLSALVENLLNWSNLQIAPILYHPNDFELNSMVYDIINWFKSEIDYKHLTIEVQVNNELQVHGDIGMIESILRNLLSNAIKFNRKDGYVKISSTEQEQEIFIIVEDKGIGIAEEDCQKLFRLDAEFKQIGTYGEVGTGMGLILAKEYVIRHGGRIWLESEVETGTKVFFTLPKAKNINN